MLRFLEVTVALPRSLTYAFVIVLDCKLTGEKGD